MRAAPRSGWGLHEPCTRGSQEATSSGRPRHHGPGSWAAGRIGGGDGGGEGSWAAGASGAGLLLCRGVSTWCGGEGQLRLLQAWGVPAPGGHPPEGTAGSPLGHGAGQGSGSQESLPRSPLPGWDSTLAGPLGFSLAAPAPRSKAVSSPSCPVHAVSLNLHSSPTKYYCHVHRGSYEVRRGLATCPRPHS